MQILTMNDGEVLTWPSHGSERGTQAPASAIEPDQEERSNDVAGL